MNNPLLDTDFLKKLQHENHNREIWGKIIALDKKENPLSQIEGQVTGGSINIDGASAIRRSCSLTLCAKNMDLDINNYYWGLNTKFNLQIGLSNKIDKNYPDIIWFPMGIYVCTSFNVSVSVNNYTINLQGKDKMAQLNGELGGLIAQPVDFNNMEITEELYSPATINNILDYEAGKYYIYRKGEESIPKVIEKVNQNKTIYCYYIPSNISNYVQGASYIYVDEIGDRHFYSYTIVDGDKKEESYTPTVEQYSKLIDKYTEHNVYRVDIEKTDSYELSIGPYDPLLQYFSKETIVRLEEMSIKQIIYYLLTIFAEETSEKIIINDLEDWGKEYLQYYNEDEPLYMLKNTLDDNIEHVFIDINGIEVVSEEEFGTAGVRLDDSRIVYDSLAEAVETQPTKVTYNKEEYTIVKLQTGDVAGYRLTKQIYPSKEFLVNPGESIASVLDKIIKVFGDYEYFYDEYGNFIFQRKKTYLNTAWTPIKNDESERVDNIYAEPLALTSSYVYSLENSDIVIQFTNTPNLGNIKNNYSIWGKRDTAAGATVPVLYRYAIDDKPQVYRTLEFLENDCFEADGTPIQLQKSITYMTQEYQANYIEEEKTVESNVLVQVYAFVPNISSYWCKNDKGELIYKQKITTINQFTQLLEQYSAIYIISTSLDTNPEIIQCDWREIIYRMAKDYNRYYNKLQLMKEYYQISSRPEDAEQYINYYKFEDGRFSTFGSEEDYHNWTEDIYIKKKVLEDFYKRVEKANEKFNICKKGITNYEKYYTDMLGFWRQIYNPDIEIKEILKGSQFTNLYSPDDKYYKKLSNGKYERYMEAIQPKELSTLDIADNFWGVLNGNQVETMMLVQWNDLEYKNNYYNFENTILKQYYPIISTVWNDQLYNNWLNTLSQEYINEKKEAYILEGIKTDKIVFLENQYLSPVRSEVFLDEEWSTEGTPIKDLITNKTLYNNNVWSWQDGNGINHIIEYTWEEFVEDQRKLNETYQTYDFEQSNDGEYVKLLQEDDKFYCFTPIESIKFSGKNEEIVIVYYWVDEMGWVSATPTLAELVNFKDWGYIKVECSGKQIITTDSGSYYLSFGSNIVGENPNEFYKKVYEYNGNVFARLKNDKNKIIRYKLNPNYRYAYAKIFRDEDILTDLELITLDGYDGELTAEGIIDEKVIELDVLYYFYKDDKVIKTIKYLTRNDIIKDFENIQVFLSNPSDKVGKMTGIFKQKDLGLLYVPLSSSQRFEFKFPENLELKTITDIKTNYLNNEDKIISYDSSGNTIYKYAYGYSKTTMDYTIELKDEKDLDAFAETNGEAAFYSLLSFNEANEAFDNGENLYIYSSAMEPYYVLATGYKKDQDYYMLNESDFMMIKKEIENKNDYNKLKDKLYEKISLTTTKNYIKWTGNFMTSSMSYYKEVKKEIYVKLKYTNTNLDSKNSLYLIADEDLGFDEKTHWHYNVIENPAALNFWIDFMDTRSEMGKYSISAIGDRSKVVNDDKIKGIYFKSVPNIIMATQKELNQVKELYNVIGGYRICQINDDTYSCFVSSSLGKSAKDELDSLLYTHTTASESISLTILPIYQLQPNTRILIYDERTKINGEYILNRISIPLTYNGTSSISAVKAVERIY